MAKAKSKEKQAKKPAEKKRSAVPCRATIVCEEGLLVELFEESFDDIFLGNDTEMHVLKVSEKGEGIRSFIPYLEAILNGQPTELPIVVLRRQYERLLASVELYETIVLNPRNENRSSVFNHLEETGAQMVVVVESLV